MGRGEGDGDGVGEVLGRWPLCLRASVSITGRLSFELVIQTGSPGRRSGNQVIQEDQVEEVEDMVSVCTSPDVHSPNSCRRYTIHISDRSI